jgi:hypothetical protein
LNEELARSVDPGSDRSALHVQIELNLQKAASEFFQSGRLERLKTETPDPLRRALLETERHRTAV